MTKLEDFEAEPTDRLPRRGGYAHPDPPERLKEHQVDWQKLAKGDRQQLIETINGAQDERPLQALFTEKPHLLIPGVLRVLRRAWVLPKPRFADKYVPDFLVGIMDSLGSGWMLVELESPTMTPINKDGS